MPWRSSAPCFGCSNPNSSAHAIPLRLVLPSLIFSTADEYLSSIASSSARSPASSAAFIEGRNVSLRSAPPSAPSACHCSVISSSGVGASSPRPGGGPCKRPRSRGPKTLPFTAPPAPPITEVAIKAPIIGKIWELKSDHFQVPPPGLSLGGPRALCNTGSSLTTTFLKRRCRLGSPPKRALLATDAHSSSSNSPKGL